MATSRLASISSTPMIREYANGAAQRAIAPVADFIAPFVPVTANTGKYKVYDEKHRFKIPNTRRAVGGRATEISWDASDATYNCTPRALDFPVDILEAAESDLEPALQEGIDMVAEVSALAHEDDVLTQALASAQDGGSKQFASNTVDPVDEIDQVILNVIRAARYGSLMGVGILFGANAWRLFKNNKNVKDRLFSGGKTALGLDYNLARGLFVADQSEVRASLLVKDSAAEGKTASVDFLLDKKVLVFARHPNPTRRDPSFMKTFRLRNRWMVPGTYMRDDGRAEIAKIDWSEDVVVTNSGAGYVITVG